MGGQRESGTSYQICSSTIPAAFLTPPIFIYIVDEQIWYEVPLSRRFTQQTLNEIKASKKMNACLYSCVFKTYLQSKKMYSDIYRLKRTCLQLRFLQDFQWVKS